MNRIASSPFRNPASLALLALTVFLAAGFPADARAAKPPALPNIVIIFADDQGYADVGVFGAKGFQTPNLDRLAAEGCKFSNFHVGPAGLLSLARGVAHGLLPEPHRHPWRAGSPLQRRHQPSGNDPGGTG